MMPDDLAARLALRYLRELSPSVRDAAVVAADGTVISGRSPAPETGAGDIPEPAPGYVRIRAEAERAAVVACAPAGLMAELARLDAATATLVVRGRC